MRQTHRPNGLSASLFCAVRSAIPRVEGLDGIGDPGRVLAVQDGALRRHDVELARDEARLVSHGYLVVSGTVRGAVYERSTAQVRVRLEHEEAHLALLTHSGGGGGGGGGGGVGLAIATVFWQLEVLQCVSHLFRCVGPAGQSDIHVLFEEASARLRWSAVGSATHEIYEKAQEDQDQEDRRRSLVEASHSWVVLGGARDVTMLVKQTNLLIARPPQNSLNTRRRRPPRSARHQRRRRQTKHVEPSPALGYSWPIIDLFPATLDFQTAETAAETAERY